MRLGIVALFHLFSLVHSVLLRPSQRSTRAPSRQILRNVDNSHYVANFTVGGQPLLGVLDTGRANLLVKSPAVRGPGAAYDHNRSSSYEGGGGKVLESEPGIDDKMQLSLSYDTVELSDGLRADHQAIYEISGHCIKCFDDFSAIIGLGPDQANISDEANRFNQTKQKTLLTNLKIDEFSICYEKEGGANGYVTWGTADDALKREHQVRAKNIGRRSWALPMRRAFFKKPKVEVSLVNTPCGGEKGCAALLDVSMSLIAVPMWHLWALSNQLGSVKDDCSDLADLPSLKFELGGQQLELPPEAYMLRFKGMSIEADSIWDLLWFKPKLRKVETCVPAFVRSQLISEEHGPVWIFGAPFFRYFHTTFDRQNNEVIFAKAGNDCQPQPLNASVAGKSAQNTSLFEAQPSSKSLRALEVNPRSLIVNPLLMTQRRGRQDANVTHVEL